MIIELDRKHNVLRIGNTSKDIERFRDVIIIYGVTHIFGFGDGWYDIHCGKEILGHLTDIESIQEKW